jgi:hypothetical protein
VGRILSIFMLKQVVGIYCHASEGWITSSKLLVVYNGILPTAKHFISSCSVLQLNLKSLEVEHKLRILKATITTGQNPVQSPSYMIQTHVFFFKLPLISLSIFMFPRKGQCLAWVWIKKLPFPVNGLSSFLCILSCHYLHSFFHLN